MTPTSKEHISYDEIISFCRQFGIDVTWRKLNYYKMLGLLPKPLLKQRKGFYSPAINRALIVYNFLQNHLGFTLSEIKDMIYNVKGAKTTIDERVAILSLWIEATYGYFIDMVFKKRGRASGNVENGVIAITVANMWYKNALKESPAPVSISIDDEKNIFDKAEKWASRAVGKCPNEIPAEDE